MSSVTGNVTHINQNSPFGSIVYQNALPKLDHENHKEFLERLQAVQETRALEKNKAVHRDKEDSSSAQQHGAQEQFYEQPDMRCLDKRHCYHGHYYSDNALERALENTEELEGFLEPHVLDVII
ncbi:hypothetical protein ACFOPX_02875 [Helicobacter baculiformis]|uniref:Uncharacterized protein n=1 Tax=Helicobacter baculiformis TaxID=427351 RepID=A0ABV7ZH77_9HELI|nr:hypothetical protein [Helicobacter baculiformis]